MSDRYSTFNVKVKQGKFWIVWCLHWYNGIADPYLRREVENELRGAWDSFRQSFAKDCVWMDMDKRASLLLNFRNQFSDAITASHTEININLINGSVGQQHKRLYKDQRMIFTCSVTSFDPEKLNEGCQCSDEHANRSTERYQKFNKP